MSKKKASTVQRKARSAPPLGSAFTEPPPNMDVNDPRWPDAFAAWAERKAKHFGMDAMEMMGRALGCDIEADAWRKKRQSALRHQEQHANDIYGETDNTPKCLMCGKPFAPTPFNRMACKKCLRSCRKKDGRP